ncbi:MAG TPA: aminoacyl-tRNA hydrolase [Acidimicrobiia bacterium]
MRVVCGLRNPGRDYEGTRHNLGSEVIDRLVDRFDTRLKRGPIRVRAQIARVRSHDLLLATPNTYVNETGRMMNSLLAYAGGTVSDLLIVHDDIDLAFGRLRLQQAGGSGGHNGIRSIESSLGSRDFWRLKLGIGRPPGSQDPADYVLRRFGSTDRQEADVLVEDASDVVERWLVDPARAQEQAAHRQPAKG